MTGSRVPRGFLRSRSALTGRRGQSERRGGCGDGSLCRRILRRGDRVVSQGRLDAGGKNQYRSDGRCCGAAPESPMDTGPGK
ncbi:hypothetical protein [Arthrobacter sp. NicSoilC5]|uniref:hypothetical protein n=1 Tax=Arthrobacter sp. NicSoilC5 TaxID=2831000 RepID=UPI001CC50DE6|nr:hypothetical protein [Arthrobacter sp. NicSoilC5]